MKIYFYVSVASSGLSLLLSIVLFAVGSSNQSLQNEVQKQQNELQKQQEEINKGNSIQQTVGPNLLNDMAVVSAHDENMKKLLSKYGYDVKVNAPAPGSSPAPAAPAPAKAPESPALRP